MVCQLEARRLQVALLTRLLFFIPIRTTPDKHPQGNKKDRQGAFPCQWSRHAASMRGVALASGGPRRGAPQAHGTEALIVSTPNPEPKTNAKGEQEKTKRLVPSLATPPKHICCGKNCADRTEVCEKRTSKIKIKHIRCPQALVKTVQISQRCAAKRTSKIDRVLKSIGNYFADRAEVCPNASLLAFRCEHGYFQIILRPAPV